MFLRQNRATGGNLPDDREAQIFFGLRQANAPPAGSRDHLDGAFPCQSPQMFFRRVGGTESQLCGNFSLVGG